MKTKTKVSIIATALLSVINLPIWFYLLYKILVKVEASELMWFFYVIYVPSSLIVGLLVHVLRDLEDK